MSEPAERVGEHGRRLIRNVLSAGGNQAGVLAIGLVVTPVLVTGLGLERYGLWALAGVIVNYIGLLDLGVGTAYLRYLAMHQAREDAERFNQVVRFGLLFYSAFALALLPIVWWTRGLLVRALAVPSELAGEAEFLLVGVTAILLLRLLFVVYRAVIAAMERLDINNRIALWVALVNGAGVVLVVRMDYGLRGLVVNGLISALLTVVFQVRAAYRLVPTLRLLPFRISRDRAPGLFAYAIRIQTARVAELINGHVDKLLLGVWIGTGAVGLYDLGLKVGLGVAALPTLLLPTVLPSSSILDARGDRVRLAGLHDRATKYVALVWAPFAALVWVAAPALFRLWIGTDQFEGAVIAARLLVLGGAPMLLFGVSRLVARGIGAPELEMRAALLLAAGNILLSVVLIRALGPLGAPLGSALAGLAGGIAFLVMFRRAVGRKYGLATLRPLAFPLCAAAAAGLAGLAAQALVPWLQLPAGRLGALAELTLTAVPMAAVYLAVLRISAAFDEYDGRVAREAWQLARTSFGRTGVGR